MNQLEREAILAASPSGLTAAEEERVIAAVAAHAEVEVRRSGACDEVLILRAALARAQSMAKGGNDARTRRLTEQLRLAEEDLAALTVETGRLMARATDAKLAAQARRRDEDYEANMRESLAHQQREQAKRDKAERDARAALEAGIKRVWDG